MIKRIIRYGVYGIVILIALPIVLFLAMPWPIQFRWVDAKTTSFMEYRKDAAREEGMELEIRHTWVPLEEIAPAMGRAVISAEDGRFREHEGIDWEALGEELSYDGDGEFSFFQARDLKAAAGAARYYLDNRDEVRGRSTITQQLAKNLYFTPDRSLSRKLGEFVVAKRLEWFLTKDRILELYLNTVELGPGIFGVEAAAQEHFGVPASKLTNYQAASLAGTLPHPLTSNPSYKPSRMAWRRDLILKRMRGGAVDGSVAVAPGPIEPPQIQVEVEEVELPPLDQLGVPEPGDPAAPDPDAPPPLPPAALDTPAVSDPVGGGPPPAPVPRDTTMARVSHRAG